MDQSVQSRLCALGDDGCAISRVKIAVRQKFGKSGWWCDTRKAEWW